jgi:hypothetical protein
MLPGLTGIMHIFNTEHHIHILDTTMPFNALMDHAISKKETEPHSNMSREDGLIFIRSQKPLIHSLKANKKPP